LWRAGRNCGKLQKRYQGCTEEILKNGRLSMRFCWARSLSGPVCPITAKCWNV
jgi:hypothetical protein